MRVRFQADADLDGRILRGLRRTAPEIDIRTAADAGLTGLADPEVRDATPVSGAIEELALIWHASEAEE